MEIPEIPRSFFQKYGFWIIFGTLLLLIFIFGIKTEGIKGAIYLVFKGAIPVLIITQLIWWIIVAINGWDISGWFFIW